MLLFPSFANNQDEDEEDPELVPVDPPTDAYVEDEDLVDYDYPLNRYYDDYQPDPEGYRLENGADPKHNQNSHQQEKSWFADLAGFRDFFLSAFADGYVNTYCCGDDGCDPCTVSGARVAPVDAVPSNKSSRLDLAKSSSYDSRRVTPRRKKPLAVAVGFNYAKDMDSRPVVITRAPATSGNHRREPIIDLTNVQDASQSIGNRRSLRRDMSSGIVAGGYAPEPPEQPSMFQSLFSF